MRMLRNLGIALALVWLVFCGLMYREMRLPPDQFAAFMAKLPDAVFLFAPFETLWSHAREGALKPGDEAPDFELPVAGRKCTGRPSFLPRQTAGHAHFRELHLTAISPGGSRARQAVSPVRRPRRVLRGLHSGSSCQRRVANAVECQPRRSLRFAPEFSGTRGVGGRVRSQFEDYDTGIARRLRQWR